ncbi:hypothetical protein M3Y99_01539700 [Aphelenchoides fujianensis]|nr:hypothetical protein M3Y99_01539700 [Aphelenchoides fujianensis]
MMKAKCEWKAGGTTSFRWTRDDALLAPAVRTPRPRPRAAPAGRANCRMSPVFPLATSTGINAGGPRDVAAAWTGQAPSPSACTVDSLDDVDWDVLTTSMWIEAADGLQIGMKDKKGKQELAMPIADFRFFADDHPPPYVLHCELRSFGNLFGDKLTREIPRDRPGRRRRAPPPPRSLRSLPLHGAERRLQAGRLRGVRRRSTR